MAFVCIVASSLSKPPSEALAWMRRGGGGFPLSVNLTVHSRPVCLLSGTWATSPVIRSDAGARLEALLEDTPVCNVYVLLIDGLEFGAWPLWRARVKLTVALGLAHLSCWL